jgi:DNA-binding XRE family transcriptional regulator
MSQQKLHNRIAVMRAERAISRKELAEAVGVNAQTIGFLERGDYSPSLELGMKIAAYFGAPVEMVFAFEAFEPLTAQLLKSKERVTG